MKEFKKDLTSALLAAKGQGKSVMLAKMLHDLPRGILIDTIGVFNPRNKYKTAIVPDSVYFMSPAAFLKYKKPWKKAVINMSELVGDELIDATDELFKYLYQHVHDMPVLVDEVRDLAPQDARYSHELERFVKNGRNYGNRPVIIATQRPQGVHKNVFDLCDNFYVSKQVSPRTLMYILDIIDRKGDETTAREIRRLKPRNFLKYSGFDSRIIKVPYYPYAFKQ